MFDKDDLSLLLLAVVFWGGPRVFESAETACHATEKRLTRIALKGKIDGKTNNTLESLGLVLAPAISRGTILENALKEKSSIPTFLLCPITYWRTYIPRGMPGALPSNFKHPNNI